MFFAGFIQRALIWQKLFGPFSPSSLIRLQPLRPILVPLNELRLHSVQVGRLIGSVKTSKVLKQLLRKNWVVRSSSYMFPLEVFL